jgi:16S rRNA (adenine1518-N6/adenine1519-N6)-dimethyltransferase
VPRARRSLGQNFLVDPNIQRKIVDAAAVGPDDHVLEIGPGHGALTDRIAGHVRHLSAVELDRDLAAALRTRYTGRDDVTLIEADVLDLDLHDIVSDPASLVVLGNIPYNITTPILFHLLRRDTRPARIVLMVQREVAERITASPGDSDYGALSVGVQATSHVEKLFHVGRNAFRPTPNVDSMVIRITPIRPAPLDEQTERDLRSLTRVAFGWRRKQLQRTLRDAPAYHVDPSALEGIARQADIDLRARPETLSPGRMIQLARALRSIGLPSAGS